MEADASTPALKEMKIQLPTRIVTALHSHKILTGENISVTIEAALTAYYAKVDGGGSAVGARPAA